MNNWKNLIPRGENNNSYMWSRLRLLFKEDPFIYSLSEPVQSGLILAIVNGGHFLRYPEKSFALSSINKMPYSAMWSDDFKDHVASMAVFAFWPEGRPE